MTIGFGNIAEPDCSVSAEKVVHPLMREEGLILLSSLLSKERTSGNIARSPLLRLTFRHSCQKVPPAGGIGVRGMPPASARMYIRAMLAPLSAGGGEGLGPVGAVSKR